jgi:hypothetical protein
MGQAAPLGARRWRRADAPALQATIRVRCPAVFWLAAMGMMPLISVPIDAAVSLAYFAAADLDDD